MTRVYLDNVITSGRARQKLDPASELDAVNALYRMDHAGRIKVVNSRLSHAEEEKAKNPAVLSVLREHRDDTSAVTNDHRLLGFSSLDYGRRGFISCPLISDIVDELLFDNLKAAGLTDSDAKHVMYAVVNDCTFFVTLDTNDLLPHKADIEAICPIRVRKPSELVAELGS